MQHKRAELRARLCSTKSTTPLQPRLCSTDSTTSLQPPCPMANPHPSSCQVTTWPHQEHTHSYCLSGRNINHIKDRNFSFTLHHDPGTLTFPFPCMSIPSFV